MHSNQEIRELVGRKVGSEASVLSVYLDIDQAASPNLNRGFETALEDLLDQAKGGLTKPGEESQFEQAATLVRQAAGAAETKGRSMVFFADASDGFLWTRQYPVQLPSYARWSHRPYVHPLAEISDDFSSYGIILVDRTHARILTAAQEELQLKKEISAVDTPARTKTTGSDQIRSSQKQIQRSADEHVAKHIHQVATAAVKLFSAESIRRVIVIGSERTAAALATALEKPKAFDVVRTATGSMTEDERRVLETTSPIIQVIEREEEMALVEQVLTTSAKGGRAVTGPAATLASINKKEVYELVYADQSRLTGSECTSCGALLLNSSSDACPYCKGTLRWDDEMLERAVERSIEMGAKIEVVRGSAAERLGETGGIGALLRTGGTASR